LATKAQHRANCNIWNGSFADINNNGTYDLPGDACDDWKALGDPGPNGRLTSAAYGPDRQGIFVSVTERAPTAPTGVTTLWAATGAGRLFVSKNSDNPANRIIVTKRGTYYVATDYGVVVKEPNSEVWKMAPAGLPNVDVADLIYGPQQDFLYAATHGQGVWQLKVQ